MSSPKPFILVVEDEAAIAGVVVSQLEAHQMQVQVFHSAAPVLPFLKRNYVNLMLLDVGLPDQSGFELIQKIREAGHEVPVIFLTAQHGELDKIHGLEKGADDYVTKPFNMEELIARIRAVLRRVETASDARLNPAASLSSEPFTFGPATVNPACMEIAFPGTPPVKLGHRELGILTFLAANPNRVVSRRSLIHQVWGPHADLRSRSVNQYLGVVRKLFNRPGCDASELIRNVHGVGYIYQPEKSAWEVPTGSGQTN